MKLICSVLAVVMFTVLAQSIAAKPPERVPPRMEEFKRESQGDGFQLGFPHKIVSWENIEHANCQSNDQRDDLWQYGARPTVAVVLGRIATAGIDSVDKDRKQRSEKRLLALYKEIEQHAKDNAKKYGVVIVLRSLSENISQPTIKLFKGTSSKHVNFCLLGYGDAVRNNQFDNYFSNYIQKPSPKMIAEKRVGEYPIASWVWMATVGTFDAWGIWGNESEMSRLKQQVKASKLHNALKIRNAKHKEIAEMLTHWRFDEAEKKLIKLEMSENSRDTKAATKLRDFSSTLENAYRDTIAGPHMESGYLIEYAAAMATYAEKYCGKNSVRGKAILSEVAELKNTEEYKHIEYAKKEYDLLSSKIKSALNGGLHGDEYARHHKSVMKKNKTSIDQFNKNYGDTPYAKETKAWGDEAAGK